MVLAQTMNYLDLYVRGHVRIHLYDNKRPRGFDAVLDLLTNEIKMGLWLMAM